MDSLLSIVENVQKNVSQFFDNSAELEQQKLTRLSKRIFKIIKRIKSFFSEANQFYDEIGRREDVQNLITKLFIEIEKMIQFKLDIGLNFFKSRRLMRKLRGGQIFVPLAVAEFNKH
jgi:excinuclease UvrABC ATPase subunit